MNDGLVGFDEYYCIGWGVLIFRNVIDGIEVQWHLMICSSKRGNWDTLPASRNGSMHVAEEEMTDIRMAAEEFAKSRAVTHGHHVQ